MREKGKKGETWSWPACALKLGKKEVEETGEKRAGSAHGLQNLQTHPHSLHMGQGPHSNHIQTLAFLSNHFVVNMSRPDLTAHSCGRAACHGFMPRELVLLCRRQEPRNPPD